MEIFNVKMNVVNEIKGKGNATDFIVGQISHFPLFSKFKQVKRRYVPEGKEERIGFYGMTSW